MKKPVPKSISVGFSFTKKDFKSYSLPSVFQKLGVEDWNDFKKLVETHNNLNKVLTVEKSLKKWIKDFEAVETKYIKNISVSSFAGKIANYLGTLQGEAEYREKWDAYKDDLLTEETNQVQERIRKRIRLIETKKVDNMVNEELLAFNTTTTSPQQSPQPAQEDKNSVNILATLFGDGEQLHKKYMANDPLSPTELKRMSIGLSGILSLIAEGREEQSDLFKKKDWDKIKAKFGKKLTISPASPSLKEKWSYITMKCLADSNFRGARKYLDRLCGMKETTDVNYNTYKMLDTVLDLLQNQQHILNTKYPDNLVEGHFTYSIWLPLLQKLCSINNNVITLKPAESISDESTIEKELIYGEGHRSLKGFKVDIRFLYSFCGHEFDICSLESCPSKATDEKAQHDQSKLIREGRTSTSSLLNATNVCSHTWTIQVSGTNAAFSTVEYFGKNLFVAKPQFNVSFPSSIGQLDGFFKDFEKLLSFQHDIEKIAHTLEAKLIARRTKHNNKTVKKNQSPTPSPPPSHLTTPSTINWLTPPKGDKKLSVIHQRNQQLLSQAPDFEIDTNSEEEPEENVRFDSDSSSEDFVQTNQGWYCKVTKSFFKSNPYASNQ